MKSYHYSRARDPERQVIAKIMALGHRRHGCIFGTEHPLAPFGLGHPRNLLSLFPCDGGTKESVIQQLISITKIDPLQISKFRNWKQEEATSQLLSVNTISTVRAHYELDKWRLKQYLKTFTRPDVPQATVSSPYAEGLNNIYGAFCVYQALTSAKIDLSVLENGSFWDAAWGLASGKAVNIGEYQSITRPQRFSCITAFESGNFLAASHFDDVVVVSCGNSLFVSELFLSDPKSAGTENGVRCLLGSIGEPEVSLLFLAGEPEAANVSSESWEMVNHAKFDGRLDDCFGATSAYLNLTGDKVPLNFGTQGACDKVVSYVEAVVSVHEHVAWTTDCSVLHQKFLSAQSLSIIVGEPPHQYWICDHAEQEMDRDWKKRKFVSIDCWSEFFDAPAAIGVIRLRGNWLTRLAMASRIMQQGHHVFICPTTSICWGCVDVARCEMAREGDEDTKTFVLV